MKRLTLIAAIAIVGAASAARACPFCSDATPVSTTSGSGSAQQTTAAVSPYNSSIYLMLGGLFAAMGLVGTMAAKGIQAADANNATRLPNISGRPIDPAISGPADIRIG